MPKSRETGRLAVALIIPVAASATGYLAYELLMVPIIVAGKTIAGGWWIALACLVPVGLVGAGVLLENRATIVLVGTTAMLFRRAVEIVLVMRDAPGLRQMSIDTWEYWTVMPLLELLVVFFLLWVGYRLGRFFRRSSLAHLAAR